MMEVATPIRPAPIHCRAGIEYGRSEWRVSLQAARDARLAGELAVAAYALDMCAFYRGFLEEALKRGLS